MATKKSGGRQPDYDVAYLNKTTSQKGRIGAAWSNPDKTISILLNPCVVVQSGPDTVLTLFPKKSGGSRTTEEAPF